MKTIKTLALFFAAALALTACSSNDDVSSGTTTTTTDDNTTKVLKLTIQGSGTKATRSYGTFDSEGNVSGVSEAYLNTLLVAIYNNKTDKVERREYITVDQNDLQADPKGGTGKVYVTNITYVAADPTIIVLANVPDTTIEIGDTKADLQTQLVNLAYTRSGSKTNGYETQNGEYLPMVGCATQPTLVSSSATSGGQYNEYEADVDLNRMVARVAVTSIKASSDMLASDTVRITDVFIRDAFVQSQMLHPDIAASSQDFTLAGDPVMDTKWIREGANFSTSGSDPDQVAEYLRNHYTDRGANGWNVTDQVDWDNNNQMAYFYIFPTDSRYVDMFRYQTQVDIRALYTRWSNGQRSTPEELYYPIVINDKATSTNNVTYDSGQPSWAGNGLVRGNRQYNIEVTIQGKGQPKDDHDDHKNPYDTEDVQITVRVSNWQPVITQKVTVGKK